MGHTTPDGALAPVDVDELAGRRARLTRRRFLQLAGGTAAGLALVPRTGFATGDARPPGGVHLLPGADPQRQVVVSWSTPGPVARPRVLVAGERFEAETRTVVRALDGVAHPTVYHHAVVDGLEPGSAAEALVVHDGLAAPLHGTVLRTAPGGLEPFTFTAFGDQGVNRPAAAITAALAGIRPAFHLVAGDLSYANSSGQGLEGDTVDPARWDAWFEQNRASMAATPWIPAVGNHDVEAAYGRRGYAAHLARFAVPTLHVDRDVEAPAFVTRWGNVAAVSIDANDVSYELDANLGYTGGAQLRWLDRALGDLRADRRVDWIVAYFHHCAFCTNSVHFSEGGVRELLVPILERHQVDVVVNGHNHNYERTFPMRGGRATTHVDGVVRPALQGTTYVTAGGGGQAIYPTPPRLPGVPTAGGVWRPDGLEPEVVTWSARRSTLNGFVRFDVTPGAPGSTTRLVMTAYDQDPSGSAPVRAVDRVVFERSAGAGRPGRGRPARGRPGG